ncbi:MAG TPA: suppressor of fused domain protein [Bryobacteraceae bacterium]|nr:suppressor of fused domain protein [Bryobacteraceae bacterium]
MKLDWFGKIRVEVGTSPAGSVTYRYPASCWRSVRTGAAGERAADFAKARKAAYRRMFGEVHRVSDEAFPLIPHIEVHSYLRCAEDGTTVCTLVTSGMSDLEMAVPAGVIAPRRAELIFYCSEPREKYVETLRLLAHFPHDQDTWIGIGHTILNGDPPAPFWGSSVLDTVLLLPPIVTRDAILGDELILDCEPVEFLWVVPLTTPECRLKLAHGENAILDLFRKHRHPHVFAADRASYV